MFCSFKEMSDMENLHEHEEKILRFLERYWREFLRSPSLDDICTQIQLPSKDHVHRDLAKLEEKGFISRPQRMARSIRLLKKLNGAPFNPEDTRPSFVSVPLLGNIAAGQPIPWPESSFSPYDYEMIDLAQQMVGRRQGMYALRVKGESMIDAMVYDGDIVIMQRDNSQPSDGEIVAVWLKDPGETTLKKFYLEGERVRLQPCNPTMKPFYADSRNVEVQGRLLSVIRRVQ
jgi:repressor LexA